MEMENGEGNKCIPNNPVLKALHVTGNHLVNFRFPRWNIRFIRGKCIDGFLTEVPNVVDGVLQAEIMVSHEDHDHVVRVASSLFDIVWEDILEVAICKFRSKALYKIYKGTHIWPSDDHWYHLPLDQGLELDAWRQSQADQGPRLREYLQQISTTKEG